MMKVHISPRFDGEDQGDGGIRRVIEAQRKYLPKHGIEVVDNVDDADLVAVHAASFVDTDKPIVSHCHGLYWDEYEWPEWCHNANRAVLDAIRKADAVTAPTEWVARAIERNSWVKPTVIGHGVTLKDWATDPSENRGYVLWNKTRVDPICDPAPLLELAKRAPDMKFVTTFGNDLPNVKVTGRLGYEDAKQFVQSASVYLCTSRETFGIGTLEAMAAGVPILGWKWGGQAEFVSHQSSGYLARPGDYDDLLAGLRYCIEHREELSAAALAEAKTRSWQRVIGEYARLYRETLDARPLKRVSVVITSYNLKQYLPGAIESVTGQLDESDELIIVDDGSTDGSSDLADKYECERVRVIHNEHNQYLAGALNTGITAALGKFIVPLDADNALEPGALSALVQPLVGSRDYDISYGKMRVENTSTDGAVWTSPWPSETFSFGAQMTHHNQIPSTSMFRKSVWARVGGYRQRCRTAEDADFWLRAASFGARVVQATSAPVLYYRDRHDSMSHTNADWSWEKWYPWWRGPKWAPPTAPLDAEKLHVKSYEPVIVSVVIPVGPGHERLVIDAIDSLVAQTYDRWEAIVVNDTGAALPWVHPFVRVLETPKAGSGPSVARNIGVNAARGGFVVPLDADDYLQPQSLELMLETWKYNGGGKLYVYGDWIVQETGEVKEAPEYSCAELLSRLPHAVTALYPREAFADVAGFDETIEAWEDWDFAIALADKGYCGIRVGRPLMQYRMSSGERREALYAQRQRLSAVIAAKWRKYFVDGEPMPCRSCGGSRGDAPTVNSDPRFDRPPQTGEMLLLEYVGKISGPTTYRGQKTGQNYRFGLSSGHKIKMVLKEDAEHLLNRGDFRLVEQQQYDILQAAGR